MALMALMTASKVHRETPVTIKPIDLAQRQRALAADTSFICEAPAGSGKTELLTQRVLTLLARVPQPEAILAITFTRKAAAEMRERILSALHKGLGPEPEEAHGKTTWQLARGVLQRDKQLAWQLLNNPNRLQIRTFDSLCAFLTQTLPLHAALGINISPSDNAEDLYQQAVNEFIQTVEQEVPWASSLAAILAHLDNKQSTLTALLVAMLKARDSWIPVVQRSLGQDNIRQLLQAQLQDVLDEKVEQLMQVLSPPNLGDEQLQQLFNLAGFAAANLRREGVHNAIAELHGMDVNPTWPGADVQGVKQWQGIKQLLLTQAGTLRANFDKRCGFPAGSDQQEKLAFKQRKADIKQLVAELADVDGLVPALVNLDFWPSAEYSDSQWPVLEHLMTLLPVVLAHLRVVFAQAQEVDFIEMSERARDALGNEQSPTELALRLDQRIEHILVDEFQDTSFGQVELLAKLTVGWQPGDGRTLFCVGDAMQSIYGFRGAKVGLFLHCKQQGLADVPLEPLQLRCNFRSQGNMVLWLNRVFEKAFPAQHNIVAGAVAYSSAQDFRDPLPGDPVQMYLSEADSDDSAEQRRMIAIIEQTWQVNEQATIAVLVRNRAQATTAIKACQTAGLRFRAVDLIPLARRAAVQDILNLCKALLDPLDRVAWFGLLRAPWCGLSLADLLCLAPENGCAETAPILESMQQLLAGGHPGPLRLSADGEQRLARVAKVLGEAFAQRERLSLRHWLEGVWLTLGGPACLADPSDVDNVQRVWQMLSGLAERGDVPSAEQLDDALKGLYAAADPLADERLQIMTIHKSKGLEFDVVILPDLHRAGRSKESELLLWSERVGRDGNEHWVLAPIHATGSDKDPIYRYVQREQKQKEQYEACRLLYVACTRAKQRMHLFARATRNSATGAWQPPANGSLLSYIWPDLQHSCVVLPGASTTAAADAAVPTPNPLRRLPLTWSGPSFAEGHLLDDYIPLFTYDNRLQNSVLLQPVTANPAAVFGSFVHELMQGIGEQGIDTWQGRELNNCLAPWRLRLLALGMPLPSVDHQVSVALASIYKVLSNKRFMELFADSVVRYPEFDLTLAAGDHSERLVIDLFCDFGDGRALIVDYKTSQPAVGQSLPAFFDQEAQTYIDALTRYQLAVAKLGYQAVTLALYFVVIDQWFELSTLE